MHAIDYIGHTKQRFCIAAHHFVVAFSPVFYAVVENVPSSCSVFSVTVFAVSDTLLETYVL